MVERKCTSSHFCHSSGGRLDAEGEQPRPLGHVKRPELTGATADDHAGRAVVQQPFDVGDEKRLVDV